jgi:hypothetical protein
MTGYAVEHRLSGRLPPFRGSDVLHGRIRPFYTRVHELSNATHKAVGLSTRLRWDVLHRGRTFCTDEVGRFARARTFYTAGTPCLKLEVSCPRRQHGPPGKRHTPGACSQAQLDSQTSPAVVGRLPKPDGYASIHSDVAELNRQAQALQQANGSHRPHGGCQASSR